MNENIIKILDLFKNYQVLSILESVNNYIVSVCDKDTDPESASENLYAIDKNTYAVSEFSYFSNPTEYAEACNNVIYKHDENELTHWGIKGMRWGVRRYQRKDGSLTPAGKKRLQAETEKVKKEEQTLKNRKSVKAKLDKLEARKKAVEEGKKELDGDKKKGEDTKPVKKTAKDMGDEELAYKIRRVQMEKQYEALTAEPETASKGSGFVKDFLNKSAVPAIQEAGRQLIRDSLLKAGKKYLGLETENAEDYVTKLGKEVKKMTLEKQYTKLKKEFAEEAEKERSRAAEQEQKKAEKAEKKEHESSESKVVEGEIVWGSGKQKKTTESGRRTVDDIIDAEFVDITPSSVNNKTTQNGRNYLLGSHSYLALPAPRDDD